MVPPDPRYIVVVEEMTEEEILSALKRFAEAAPKRCLALVGEDFDIDGQQKAIEVRPTEIKKVTGHEGDVWARVDFSIDHKNPVDETDVELSAENVITETRDVRLAGADFETIAQEGFQILPNSPLPD